MFINKQDFKSKINLEILEQILEGDDSLIEDAETTAQAIVVDALCKQYDLSAEWDKTGKDRNRRLLNWMLNMMAYFLYGGIPDNEIPERITKDYDDTRKELKLVEDAKIAVNLPHLVDDTGRTKTKFAWGSLPPRQHSW